MIENKSVLAIIPARGGSKGLPRKNVLPVCNKPLIAWSIEEAKKSSYIDRLILTSDDDEIISVAKAYDCEVPFKRPGELASDTASTYDVVEHAINALDNEYDLIVLLQPTSPLRNCSDIDKCIFTSVSHLASCASVTKATKPPHWMFEVNEKGELQSFVKSADMNARRQDFKNFYSLNGAVYVVHREWFLKNKTFVGEGTLSYEMPPERSIDIDTKFDMDFFCYLVNENKLRN